MGLTIVGLGPGPYDLLTRAAARALESAPVVRLRTARHPTVDEFPSTIRWTSFDDLYEQLESFDGVYNAIVDSLLTEARGGAEVVYAVPGDPSLGETTVSQLRRRASEEGIPVRIIPGVPFASAVLRAVPPLEHANLQLADALHAEDVDPTTPLLVYQVYSPIVAAHLKLDLLRRYPPEHRVFVVRSACLPEVESVRELALEELDRQASFDHLTSVYVPALSPESAYGSLQGLRAIVRRLRSPEGCPWDRAQTHQSIRRYVLEEAYEVADAIDAEDSLELREELGDLLLQVVLHAQIADDEGEFDLDDVIRRLSEKLVGRHPHVFGGAVARTAEEVERNWEALKRAEKGAEGPAPSLLDGVPRSMPALRAAQEVCRRLREAGVELPSAESLWHRAHRTLGSAAGARAPGELEARLGETLWLLAQVSAAADVDLESALEASLRRLADRVREAESRARATGQPLRLAVADALAGDGSM